MKGNSIKTFYPVFRRILVNRKRDIGSALNYIIS